MAIRHEAFLSKKDEYDALPENVLAEFIDGDIVYLAAPSRHHQTVVGEINTVIHDYINRNNGACHVYHAPFAVQLNADDDTTVEPDIAVICDKDKLTDAGCTGAPDWIIEVVSPGNVGHDYIRKLHLYEAAGVREYWIVDPMQEMIHVYSFSGENSEVAIHSFDNTVKAGIYDDLEIDFTAIRKEMVRL